VRKSGNRRVTDVGLLKVIREQAKAVPQVVASGPVRRRIPLTAVNTSLTSLAIREGKRVLLAEADAIRAVADRLDQSFARAVTTMLSARIVHVAGVGKSGDIGRKIAHTLTSLGTQAVPLCPLGALHGDLGLVGPDDAAVLISRSGECDEVVALAEALRALHSPRIRVIVITGAVESRLAKLGDVVLDCYVESEAGKAGLAPTCSTAASMAMGDALASVLEEVTGFGAEDFRRLHPGGALGVAGALAGAAT
jgi:arabinose-5-phosphate isomerase